MKKFLFVLFAACAVLPSLSQAVPVNFTIDPEHTYPAFEADHLGGLSVWRGKLTQTAGKIMLDREAKTGTVDIVSQASSLDFGHAKMNEHAQSRAMFNADKYPTISYRGTLANFDGDKPTAVEGELTLHGVTKPVTLQINQFLCKKHPMKRREVCGADASALINRADFGIDFGEQYGFNMQVKLLISIEALAED